MARNISRFLFLSLLLAMPAWSAQDQNQGPKPGESSSRPQGPAQAPDVEAANARSDTASAAEDVEVASFYLRKGDPNAAIPRLQEAIQLKPNWGQPRLQLAEAYEDRRQTQRRKDLQRVPTSLSQGSRHEENPEEDRKADGAVKVCRLLPSSP